MPKSDYELCIRLAEWRGLEDVRMGVLAYWFTPTDCGYKAEPQRLDGMHPMTRDAWVYKDREPDKRQQGHCRDSGYEVVPAYDTDPVAALELLGWLAKRGWSYVCGWDQADGDQRFCRLWKHVEAPGPDGKRRSVITEYAVTESKAIAKAADKVRESEVSDE